ncbi:protein THYLAKOID ASSEMBLY 8, chloroplastic [Musa acuminata AAA Group]|uniref:protein THYLAKOID ASSEMBLY 8, chloroplastic n=1 Tax=Musa acuminata AAA Group TaxID=214697 RepID=UPI0031D1E698
MSSLSLLRLRPYRHPDAHGTLIAGHGRSSLPPRRQTRQGIVAAIPTGIVMRDRAKNRKPTQRGRYLSTEAIQAVQALKRALGTVGGGGGGDSLERVLAAKVRRLIKGDMVAVLRELQSQGEGLLALQVFEEVRREHWYKPQLSVYNDMIKVLASCGLPEKVEKLPWTAFG